jgi:heme-degrading monooxygenase HmoA
MYMRMVNTKVRKGELDNLRKHYDKRVIPTLQGIQGCLYAGLMQSTHHPDECISMTLWKSQADADAYELGGVFQDLLEITKPYLSESSESRIQLSEDLTLEYVSVPDEPVVETYNVEDSNEVPKFEEGKYKTPWLRTVSMKVREDKLEEFKRIYKERAVPALREVKGCRYVFLTQRVEKRNEVISVTIWDSKEEAESYVRSGLFHKLLEAQKHTLSELYQWKMDREKEEPSHVATSEDLAVETYDVLSARSFT